MLGAEALPPHLDAPIAQQPQHGALAEVVVPAQLRCWKSRKVRGHKLPERLLGRPAHRLLPE